MKMTFSPVTPIFIGSGEEYYPNDYIVFENELGFIDKTKFLEKVEKENRLDEFIKVSDNIDKLLDFIYEIGDDSVCREIISGEGNVLDELYESNSREVDAFVKDKFLFTPIIPGSSIKGVIRTALLDYLSKIYKYKVRSFKELEAKFFCNNDKFDAKKDIFKALIITDFNPKNYELKVMKLTNRPFKKEKDNPIPVVLEMLVDGEFEGEIKIDKNLLNKDKNLKNNPYFQNEPLSIDLIKKALKQFFSGVVEKENQRFRANNVKYEEFLIKIGKHGGAGSKSISKERQVFIKQLKKKFEYQLSIWIDNLENPVGWGKLQFKD